MEAIVLKCKAHNPIHLGQTSLEDSDIVIHSDTLFSALINMYVMAYGTDRLPDLYQCFDQGLVRISSAFPCLQGRNGNWLWLLPKPERLDFEQDAPDDAAPEDTLSRKEKKSVAFVSRGYWDAYMKRESLADSLLLGGNSLVLKSETDAMGLGSTREIRFMEKQTRPKVHARKPSDDNAYFVVTTVNPLQIRERRSGKLLASTHFYFLLDHEDECDQDILARLRSCVRLLADEGLGGERSAGCGGFPSIEEIANWQVPGGGSGDKHVSLSMSIPESAEAFQAYDYYRLQMRGGSAIPHDNRGEIQGFAGFDRKQVQMIGEGAVLSQEVSGMIADLAISPGQEQPIWRYGKLFTLKL